MGPTKPETKQTPNHPPQNHQKLSTPRKEHNHVATTKAEVGTGHSMLSTHWSKMRTKCHTELPGAWTWPGCQFANRTLFASCCFCAGSLPAQENNLVLSSLQRIKSTLTLAPQRKNLPYITPHHERGRGGKVAGFLGHPLLLDSNPCAHLGVASARCASSGEKGRIRAAAVRPFLWARRFWCFCLVCFLVAKMRVLFFCCFFCCCS